MQTGSGTKNHSHACILSPMSCQKRRKRCILVTKTMSPSLQATISPQRVRAGRHGELNNARDCPSFRNHCGILKAPVWERLFDDHNKLRHQQATNNIPEMRNSEIACNVCQIIVVAFSAGEVKWMYSKALQCVSVSTSGVGKMIYSRFLISIW